MEDASLRDAIASNLARVQDRVATACAAAGRSPDDITLVAVSKTFPVAVVQAGVAAGLRDFGENRVQELTAKGETLPARFQGGRVCWHLIGSLQRNKAKAAVAVADVFHALDSLALAQELDTRCAALGRVLPCFVQVNVSQEATKSGVAPEATFAFLDAVAGFQHLQIEGLMTLAAPVDTPAEVDRIVRPQFQQLRRLAETYPGHDRIRLRALSMGMSGDYACAIEEGATHIRVGSALFGHRG